ncbi:MAG: hypothetical protein AAFX93_18070 [Verrucomicrobiota bacterium]
MRVSIRNLFILCILPFCVSAQQRTQIGAPVENFRLPIFGENGNRIWDLRGEVGIYQDDQTIAVERMILRTFPEDDPQNPELIIESPQAVIVPAESRAHGDAYLFLQATDGSYAIVGRQWEWFNEEQRITIGSDARVTFRQKIGSILE